MRLIIDDREQQVIPFFKEDYKEIEIEIEVKRINIGDYAIYQDDTLLFIIERKSWKDLSASMRDGRKENINKLLLARQETGCKIIYLIEGKARYPANKKIARIPYKNLQSHLDHLIIRDDVYIIYSNTPEDTSNRLIEFMVNYMSIVPTIKIAGNKTQEPFDLMQKFTKSDLEIIYSIWRCIPGITDKTTSLFINNYHISDLILGNIQEADISTMKYPNGAIIGKRASKIHKVSIASPETFKVYCKMLSCINGVTDKTAALIVTKFGFHEVLSGAVSQEELSELKKTEKSKLGKKISAEIVRFFVKQNNE